MTQVNTQIVISAVDKATATLSLVSARLDGMTKPARDLGAAFGRLYQATGLGAVKSALGGLKDSVVGLATSMVGLGGVYSGTVGSIMLFANHAADAVDKIGDLSARYQVHANTLQVYGSLVEEAGGSMEDAAAGMGKLRKAMNEAIHGGKDQAAAFAGVGISIEQLKSMAPEDVMASMADAFKNSGKEGEKNAVLLELMGKNGTIFMDVMNKGSEAYRARLEEMRADGSLLSQEQLQQADDYDKSWKRLQRTMEGIKNALGLKLANALEGTVQAIQKWIVANRALIDQKFDKFLQQIPAIMEMGGELLRGMWEAVQFLGAAFKGLSGVLGPTGAVLTTVFGLMSPMILAAGTLGLNIGKMVWVVGNATGVFSLLGTILRGLYAVFLANPIGLLITSIATLAYVIYKNWDGIVQYVSDAWERIKAVFQVGFFDGLFQLWLEGWQAFGNAIVGIVKTLTPDFLMPEAMKKFEFTFASQRAQNVTAAQAAQAQRQDIKNTIRVQIDAEGRPRVKELSAGSDATTIDVSAGLYMAGA